MVASAMLMMLFYIVLSKTNGASLDLPLSQQPSSEPICTTDGYNDDDAVCVVLSLDLPPGEAIYGCIDGVIYVCTERRSIYLVTRLWHYSGP